MIPKNESILMDYEIEQIPSRTYNILMEQKKIVGKCTGLDAVKQAVYLILNIERYDWIIFSWNYGIELRDLFGKPIPFVLPELKRRITEALLQDDRIKSVDDFDFEVNRNKVHCLFTVYSDLGSFEEEMDVEI